MAQARLTAARYEVSDALEAIEFYYEKGWTDGLPVVPPTEAKVREMLHYIGRAPENVIATVPVRRRVITAEKVAINAVMAGCRPEYMPVVVAAVEGICDEAFAIHGPSASTGSAGILTIINGPIAQKLAINATHNVLGPGARANATIGRALRLFLINGLGAIPGVMDRSTLGHGGKYSYCIAENEADSPWEPLHVERGFARHESAVTVFAAEAPIQVNNHISTTAEGILTTVADAMCHLGGPSVTGGAQYVIVISPEHQATIVQDGWSKKDIRQFLFEKARRTVADLKRGGRMKGEIQPGDEAKRVAMFQEPEDIMVVAAGGPAGRFSAAIPGWAGGRGSSRPVTKRIAI